MSLFAKAAHALAGGAALARDPGLSPIWGKMNAPVNPSCIVDGDWDEIQQWAEEEIDPGDRSRCPLRSPGCACGTGVVQLHASMGGLVVLAAEPETFHRIFAEQHGDPDEWDRAVQKATGLPAEMADALFRPEKTWNAWIPKRYVAETLEEAAKALEEGRIHHLESCRAFMRKKLDEIQKDSPADLDNGHMPPDPHPLLQALLGALGKRRWVRENATPFERLRARICSMLLHALDRTHWHKWQDGTALRIEHRRSR